MSKQQAPHRQTISIHTHGFTLRVRDIIGVQWIGERTEKRTVGGIIAHFRGLAEEAEYVTSWPMLDVYLAGQSVPLTVRYGTDTDDVTDMALLRERRVQRNDAYRLLTSAMRGEHRAMMLTTKPAEEPANG